MIESAIPQDILKYKQKFIGNFSLREIVCIGLGLAAGALSYFYIFGFLSGNAKVYVSAFVILPFLLFGFCKPWGQPLEKVLFFIIYDNFICPPSRKYEIRYPKFESYLKDRDYLENMGKEIVETDSSKDEKSGKNKNKKNQKNQVIKVAKSKEYKAIR